MEAELRCAPAVWDPAGAQRSNAASSEGESDSVSSAFTIVRAWVRSLGLTAVMRMVIISVMESSSRKNTR